MSSRSFLPTSFLALAVLVSCSAHSADITDLGYLGGGKSDFFAIENLPIHVPAASDDGPGVAAFSLTAGDRFVVQVQQDSDLPISLRVEGGVDLETEPDVAIRETIDGPFEDTAYVIEVRNHGDEALDAKLSLLPATSNASDEIPSVDDDVVMENEFCTYQNKTPYVKEVNWDHPKIVKAMRALGPGWHSTFAYADWRVSHGLENENTGSDTERRNKKVRNFIRVLCGEYRDYPKLLEAKLDVVGNRQIYAGKDEVKEFDLSRELFEQITFPAYRRMVQTMGAMHRFRQQQRADENDGFNFNIGDFGAASNRVENSVPPWTHCEMKYMFSHFMVDGAPRVSAFISEDTDEQVKPETYEEGLAEFRANECTTEDNSLMYNFRGHNNYKALWLESNAFMWNSRRGRKVKLSRGSDEYYLHPFAERHARARAAWGSYLFHTDEDNESMRFASDFGGGPIMYITDQDLDGNHLADYRLFPDDDGCGDQGVGVMNPDENCNMVPWDQAAETPNSVGHASAWNPSRYDSVDMGFMSTFTTFDERMARFNQALDRHTNWGPTSYYMIDASDEDAANDKIRMIGAYSPIVACSYDISASDFFARRDFIFNEFEAGQTKWMFVMRFKAEDYYDEKDMKAGRPMDFFRNYFNETSLSNDFFNERALDRFGFVPPTDIHAVLYFVYGDRGEDPPELENIPAP